MYKVQVSQKKEGYTYNDSIYGEFKTHKEALDFQHMVLENFENVTVRISFMSVETNIVEDSGE